MNRTDKDAAAQNHDVRKTDEISEHENSREISVQDTEDQEMFNCCDLCFHKKSEEGDFDEAFKGGGTRHTHDCDPQPSGDVEEFDVSKSHACRDGADSLNDHEDVDAKVTVKVEDVVAGRPVMLKMFVTRTPMKL